MADYITKIRTVDGDKQIDYNALANLPNLNVLNPDQYGPELPEAGTPGRYFLIPSEDLYASVEHTHTAADVGAAPSGYGLGVKNCSKITTWEQLNATVANGWYWLEASTSGTNGLNGIKSGMLRVCTQDGWYAVQELYPPESNWKFERRMNAQVWGNWVRCDSGAFAPSGYGLGTNAVNVSSADNINANGYYETAIALNGGNESCIVWHNQHSANYAEQKAVSILGGYVGSMLHRIKTNGTWQPWEWENPPMTIGVEYRTTERYKGKAVYVKLVEQGEVPSAASGSYAQKALTLGFRPFYVFGWTSGDAEVYKTMPNSDVTFAINSSNVLYLVSYIANTDNKKAYYIFKYTKD